jgi:hypothetical protein
MAMRLLCKSPQPSYELSQMSRRPLPARSARATSPPCAVSHQALCLPAPAECLAASRSPSRRDSSFEICEACATPTPDAISRLLA